MIEPLATQKEDYMQVLNQFCNDLHNLDANLHTGSSDEKTISNAELRAQIRLQIADLIVTKVLSTPLLTMYLTPTLLGV